MRVLAAVVVLLTLGPTVLVQAPRDRRPRDFWDETRRGGNLFNRVESEDRLRAAVAAKLAFARLAPTKWRAAGRDFLIGDADRFERIPPPDLAELRRHLDAADRAGLRIVLTTLSLPGARWRQQNGNRSDVRLWTDERFALQAEAFWQALARELKGHPAVAALNLLNEPHPELVEGPVDELRFDPEAYMRRHRGTPRDLNTLYARLVRAIRAVDPVVPVVLDAGLYASPHALPALDPLADANVLYSFHMYEPYVLTAFRQNGGRYTYPGRVGQSTWDRAALSAFLEPVREWQRRHRVPQTRILVGEFGCDRRVPGADRYLADLVSIFEAERWHWAFYAFREDTWDAMDYELGSARTPAGFWAALEAGRTPEVTRGLHPAWRVLQDALSAGAGGR